MRLSWVRLPKKAKVFASVGAVVLVGGICAGAGLLIYQATAKTGVPATEDGEVDTKDLQRLFPGAASFEHFAFLDGVKPAELPLARIVDVKAYAADGKKVFQPDNDQIADAFFQNALKHATRWALFSDYATNSSLFSKKQIIQRISDQEIQVVFGIAATTGPLYYDAGKLVV